MGNAANHIDSELILRIATGDEQAFEQLFNSYHHKLAHYIFGFTRSRNITQEIVQDTFLKIWLSRETLTGIDNFDSYLFVMARNRTYNVLKQMATLAQKQDQWEKDLPEENQRNAERTHYQETSSEIEKAIQSLPPQQQKIFLLSRDHDLTHEQIAQELNLSIHTVKKHMTLALSNLRAKLGISQAVLLLILSARYLP